MFLQRGCRKEDWSVTWGSSAEVFHPRPQVKYRAVCVCHSALLAGGLCVVMGDSPSAQVCFYCNIAIDFALDTIYMSHAAQ